MSWFVIVVLLRGNDRLIFVMTQIISQSANNEDSEEDIWI